ncbi:hypothetical protein NEDG_00663 [Nematocida displodere]|uniref:2Fe-2S ferredoxin n=1 Tax=Nematocida displodere TaxID=1805483 RepID=A0A177EDQ8_9MICR|nr:hypothetical protein NEDG_00663 [Nematocida displodere]
MNDSVRVLFSAKEAILPIVVKTGLSLLEAAHINKVPLQGACEGSLACSTCHVVLDRETYQKNQSTLTEREEDLLDTAKGLTRTSRLGCQLFVNRSFENRVIRIPNISKNIGEEVVKK